MASPHPRRRVQGRRRTRPSSSRGNPISPTTSSSRRISLLIIACTIPFAIIVITWQHSQLMERLEGGGEYAAYVDDEYIKEYSDGYENNEEGGGETSSWGESVQQAVDVVKFVAYGSGE